MLRIPSDRHHLQAAFANRGDSFWGVSVSADGESTFPATGFSGVCCTGYARAVESKLATGRVSVFGFHEHDNPTSAIAQWAGGHDFAIVDGRFIVDPWLELTIRDVITVPFPPADTPPELIGRIVFDLAGGDDRLPIDRLYGNRRTWAPVKSPRVDS